MEESRPDFSKMNTAEKLMPQEEMLEVASKKRELTIGVPKEVSTMENRVSLIPDGLRSIKIESTFYGFSMPAGVSVPKPPFSYSVVSKVCFAGDESV